MSCRRHELRERGSGAERVKIIQFNRSKRSEQRLIFEEAAVFSVVSCEKRMRTSLQDSTLGPRNLPLDTRPSYDKRN